MKQRNAQPLILKEMLFFADMFVEQSMYVLNDVIKYPMNCMKANCSEILRHLYKWTGGSVVITQTKEAEAAQQ